MTTDRAPSPATHPYRVVGPEPPPRYYRTLSGARTAVSLARGSARDGPPPIVEVYDPEHRDSFGGWRLLTESPGVAGTGLLRAAAAKSRAARR